MSGNTPDELIYTVADGLDVVVLDPNEVLVQFGTRSLPAELLRDPNRRGMLGPIINEFLRGPSKVSEVFALLGMEEWWTEFEPVIADLILKGILTEASLTPVEQYLTYTFTGNSSLRGKNISIVGAGPIGARIARSLVQHGVGKIRLLDDRIADDLWQMYQPFGAPGQAESSSNANKTCAQRLRDLLGGSSVGVDAIDEGLNADGLRTAVESADLTLVAFEQRSLTIAHLVNRICIKENKPWIVASTDGNQGLIGPLFLGQDTACYNCYEALSDSVITARHMLRRYRKHVLHRGAGSFFSGLPAFSDITAGYIVLAAVHYLLGKPSFLEGRLMNINFDRMVINLEDVLKLPRCPVCGDNRAMYRPPFALNVVKQV